MTVIVNFWEPFFGTIALILWSIQLIPQIIKNHKKGSTLGLSPYTFMIWSISNILVASNSIINQASIPIIIQPHVFNFLSIICLVQCYYYTGKKDRIKLFKSMAIFILILILAALIEFLYIYILLYFELNDIFWCHYLFGCLGPIVVCLGFIPQYLDVIKLKSTSGISLLFIYLDLIGGISALISLSLHEVFELTVALTYIGVMCAEIGLLMFKVYYEWDHYKLDFNFLKSKVNPSPYNPKTIDINLDKYGTSSILPVYLTHSYTESSISNSNRISIPSQIIIEK